MINRNVVAAVFAACATLGSPSPCLADSNKGDVQKKIESEGGTVYWGQEIDHAEYGKAVAAAVAGALPEYLADLGRRIQQSVGITLTEAMLDQLRRKGDLSVNFGNFHVSGGIATYEHWRMVSHHFWDGWPPKWKRIENKLPLPNTHQFYLRIKRGKKQGADEADVKKLGEPNGNAAQMAGEAKPVAVVVYNTDPELVVSDQYIALMEQTRGRVMVRRLSLREGWKDLGDPKATIGLQFPHHPGCYQLACTGHEVYVFDMRTGVCGITNDPLITKPMWRFRPSPFMDLGNLKWSRNELHHIAVTED